VGRAGVRRPQVRAGAEQKPGKDVPSGRSGIQRDKAYAKFLSFPSPVNRGGDLIVLAAVNGRIILFRHFHTM